MSELNLSGADLLAWSDETGKRWEQFITEHPAVLQLQCDIAGVHSVAELLQHVVVVELRYAERLCDKPVTEYPAIGFGSAQEIYATHRRAMELWAGLLADGGYDWTQIVEYTARSGGKWSSSAKKIFFHALLHGIRHYAQVGTIVRQHGYKPEWLGDFIGTETMS
jgi:uncharacterized damage-inducible protein DinB